ASRVLWAALLWAAWIVATPATTPPAADAVVTSAEGPPFELVRGARLFTGTRGTHLSPGDLIKTQPGSFLILEFSTAQSGRAVAAIGPSSRMYWIDKPDAVYLAFLGGMIKIDAPAGDGQPLRVVTEGTRLRAVSDGGSYVVNIGDTSDEVFHEKGSVRVEM